MYREPDVVVMSKQPFSTSNTLAGMLLTTSLMLVLNERSTDGSQKA